MGGAGAAPGNIPMAVLIVKVAAVYVQPYILHPLFRASQTWSTEPEGSSLLTSPSTTSSELCTR